MFCINVNYSVLVITIETKEKKVTVMTAKPSSLPTYLAQLPKPVPPKPLLPQQKSYNDQFAQFLSSKKTAPAQTPIVHNKAAMQNANNKSTTPNPSNKPAALAVPANVTAKVVVHSSQPPPLALSTTNPKQMITIVNKSPTIVTPAQRKQEEWTQMVLSQSQQAATSQKVTTERIQPYVPGQSQFYANPLQSNGGPNAFYTIMNSASGAQPRVPVSGRGYDRKNC